MMAECDNGTSIALAQAKSRAFIPPLELQADMTMERKRLSSKKEKEVREQYISDAETRLLEMDVPITEDEFERLVRSSPNSSFVWIKYMAFMLSLADVEKARSIAERALRTINIQEQNEKLNIWIAYFNLENEYGEPPKEAVRIVFERALQHCEPKKVHLALLGLYERTKQHQLADELLEKMTKKFKHSCKFLFKKYLEFEKSHGNEQRVEYVKQKAMEYVGSIVAS